MGKENKVIKKNVFIVPNEVNDLVKHMPNKYLIGNRNLCFVTNIFLFSIIFDNVKQIHFKILNALVHTIVW